ncbi:ribonuclease H [Trifolium pratense]|uniref:Ribonuclease H n=1 Tax=Trifolium pratense TaxID=57577 RepID=A0A2K3LGI6_TRIPR|nr:ribonuclease H [Trifolium pratense]
MRRLQDKPLICRNVLPITKNSVSNILGSNKFWAQASILGYRPWLVEAGKLLRIWKKINLWSIKCLFQPGREILIKSALQSISAYVMSIFLIRTSLSDEIEKMLNSFWCGHNSAQSKGSGMNISVWDRNWLHDGTALAKPWNLNPLVGGTQNS